MADVSAFCTIHIGAKTGPGTMNQRPTTTHQGPRTSNQGPRTCDKRLETKGPGPGTRDLGPGTWDQGFGGQKWTVLAPTRSHKLTNLMFFICFTPCFIFFYIYLKFL